MKTNQTNVDTTKTITHISLCSGYSGIGLGLKRVLPTLREIAHVEIEAYAVANLVKKMEESSLPAAPIFTNLKTFPFSSFRGCVDILSGGFPCQPFSAAGKRKATEDPRHLFPYIKDGIGLCRPGLVFLENVEGIISAKTGIGESVLQYVLRELESLGYTATAGIFSASEVGASHQRKRVFILAVENSSNIGERNNSSGGDRQEVIRPEDGKECTVWAESASAMGNTERERPQRAEPIGRKEPIDEQPTNASGEAVADTKHTRPHGATQPGGIAKTIRDDEERQDSPEQSERIGISCELADTNSPRLQRCELPGGTNTEGWQEPTGHPAECRTIPIARPGEEQFAHEEPRTKPKLGRAANVYEYRVDSLRMSGNGVVPATAELAFRILRERLA